MDFCKKEIAYLAMFLFSLIFITNSNALPLPARLSANGYTSDYTVGQADLMVPIVGDTHHNFYLDPTVGIGSDSQGYADLGVGYRWVQSETAILGGYLFGGYSRLANNARVWVINPGIEAMGSRWDAHLNAYVVTGDRHDSLGNFLLSNFSGHSIVEAAFNTVQYTGDGTDIGVAYQLFSQTPLKGFLGGYFFAPSQGNVGGGVAGLEFWLESHLKIFAAYSYDNVRHSTGALGLGVEFGGTHYHRTDPDLEERITDPVTRYLAELGHGSKIPTRIKSQPIGQGTNISNIAFFSQTGTPNNGGMGLTADNCTFENPCGKTDLTDMGAMELNNLLPNTIMYFNGGNYDATDTMGGSNPVTLSVGQSIESRTSDYSQPATGVARSTFTGGFNLPGENTLSNIVVLPSSGVSTGVNSTGGTNFISGSQIGSQANPYDNAVVITAGELTSQNNTLYANTVGFEGQGASTSNLIANTITITGGTGTVSGIVLSDTATATISQTTINTSNNDDANVSAINLVGSASATVSNSRITMTEDSSGGVASLFNDTGVQTLNVSNSTISVQNAGTGSVYGLNSASGINTIENSQFTISGNDSTGLFAVNDSSVQVLNTNFTVTGIGDTLGVSAGNDAQVEIANSMFDLSTTGGILAGFYANGGPSITANETTVKLNNTGANITDGLVTNNASSSITFDKGTLDVTGPSASLSDTSGGGTIIISNSTTCILNGGTVPCPP